MRLTDQDLKWLRYVMKAHCGLPFTVGNEAFTPQSLEFKRLAIAYKQPSGSGIDLETGLFHPPRKT